ncbi:MAG: glycoside hydrolase family 127 protein, partial [Bacteroidaceae bacterium]|nr:glycoside hydrolase family 127 protein [Bacteroidaceae bacterium]
MILRRMTVFLLVLLLVAGLQAKVAEATQVKRVSMEGYIGKRVDDCIRKRVMGQNVDELVEPFKLQDETQGRWASEFWGKWIQGAMSSYQYNQDPALYHKIKDGAEKLMATQLSNGYIGDYDTDHQLKGWDVWGRKYTLLGLLKWYRLSGDKNALKSACRLLDYTLTQIGPGKAHIYSTGFYRGMPPSSILEPVMMMYNLTKNPRYLDFA